MFHTLLRRAILAMPIVAFLAITIGCGGCLGPSAAKKPGGAAPGATEAPALNPSDFAVLCATDAAKAKMEHGGGRRLEFKGAVQDFGEADGKGWVSLTGVGQAESMKFIFSNNAPLKLLSKNNDARISGVLQTDASFPALHNAVLLKPTAEEHATMERNLKAAAEKAVQVSRVPSRANYNRIQNGMTLAEAQDILGPGKEAAQGGGTQIVTWERTEGFQITVISITFQDNRVQAKAIVGP